MPVLHDRYLILWTTMRDIIWLCSQSSVLMPNRSSFSRMSGYGNVQGLVTKINETVSLDSDRNSLNFNKEHLPVGNWNKRKSNFKVISSYQNQKFVFHLKNVSCWKQLCERTILHRSWLSCFDEVAFKIKSQLSLNRGYVISVEDMCLISGWMQTMSQELICFNSRR